MSDNDPHHQHGSVVLTVTTTAEDGSRVFRSWGLCECALPTLIEMIGEPQDITHVTADSTWTPGACA